MYRFILFLFILTSSKANCQIDSIAAAEVEQYRIDRANYKDDSGKWYGAGSMADAYNIVVSFKQVLYNKRNAMITIKGTTYGVAIDSTTRLDGTEIFTAQPKRKRLKRRQILSYSNSNNSGEKKVGDFDITFKVRKHTHLYFEEGKSYYLLEYNIGKLISALK